MFPNKEKAKEPVARRQSKACELSSRTRETDYFSSVSFAASGASPCDSSDSGASSASSALSSADSVSSGASASSAASACGSPASARPFPRSRLRLRISSVLPANSSRFSIRSFFRGRLSSRPRSSGFGGSLGLWLFLAQGGFSARQVSGPATTLDQFVVLFAHS